MNNYFRPQGERSYIYDGKCPYSAGDLFCIDTYLDYDFSGNAIEEIINSGVASYDGKYLHFKSYDILMVDEVDGALSQK